MEGSTQSMPPALKMIIDECLIVWEKRAKLLHGFYLTLFVFIFLGSIASTSTIIPLLTKAGAPENVLEWISLSFSTLTSLSSITLVTFNINDKKKTYELASHVLKHHIVKFELGEIDASTLELRRNELEEGINQVSKIMIGTKSKDISALRT